MTRHPLIRPLLVACLILVLIGLYWLGQCSNWHGSTRIWPRPIREHTWTTPVRCVNPATHISDRVTGCLVILFCNRYLPSCGRSYIVLGGPYWRRTGWGVQFILWSIMWESISQRNAYSSRRYYYVWGGRKNCTQIYCIRVRRKHFLLFCCEGL